MDLPDLGFGTWQLRGDDCVQSVSDALDQGYRHIDTAHVYGNHREVGEGIRRSGVVRESFVLASKIWHTDLRGPAARDSIERALDELGVDYLDLMYIHWPSPEGVPVQQTLDAMVQAREDGLIRGIGVSNFPPGLFDTALAHARIEAHQVEHHPLLGQEALLARCDEHDVTLVAYSPLARGKVREEPVLVEIGEAHGASPEQVSLAWLVARDRRVAIPKASSSAHRRANLASLGLELSEAELDRIDALPKDQRLISPSFAPDWENG